MTTASPEAALNLLETLVKIGAPTFREKRRSDFILAWLRENVSPNAMQDDLSNVWVDLSGDDSATCLLDAHIDTVFSHVDVPLRKTETIWYAPGVFDNTVTCAILMTWAAQLTREEKRAPFILSFSAGEEGEGNLFGVRATAERFAARLRAAVALDLRTNVFSRRAVGSVRYHLGWKTLGGHSWNDFGNPNAIHLAARWIESLHTAFPWKLGERTFNIGTIEGGTGINVIAQQASLKLDVRSIDPAFLKQFDEWLRASIGTQELAPISLISLGHRPAGELPEHHFLVQTLADVHRTLGVPLTEKCLSTNGNALLDAGIPTIVTGIAEGGKYHTEEEFLNVDSVAPGLRKLTLLTEKLATTGVL